MNIDIKEQCNGRWDSILRQFIQPEYLTGRHMACPACRAGKDRFRIVFGDENGRWFCNTCRPEGGSGIDLIMLVNSTSFKETCSEIRKILGTSIMTTQKPKPDPLIKLKFIHKGLKKIKRGDSVSRYLRHRGINIIPTHNLFIHTNIPYFGGYVDGKKVEGVFNAMIGRITNSKGELESYHITYLDNNNRKISIAPAKIIITPRTTISGCGVKFGKPSETIGIAEGIETALAVQENEGITCWAGISESGVRNIQIPDVVKNVEIYADNDKNFVGLKAAYTLANTLHNKGKNVNVFCNWVQGEDYLDWINRNTVTSKDTAMKDLSQHDSDDGKAVSTLLSEFNGRLVDIEIPNGKVYKL